MAPEEETTVKHIKQPFEPPVSGLAVEQISSRFSPRADRRLAAAILKQA